MKFKLYFIYDVLLFGLVLYAFVFGGFFQFFIGLPPTPFSIIITFFILLLLLINRKILLDKQGFYFALITLILVVYTFSISFFRGVNLFKPIIYCFFYLIPFMVYVLFKIRLNNKGVNLYRIKKLLLILAICQFPILLIQKFLYPFIISFNHSGQSIRDIDFMFGSFLVKNDHALGFFLIVNILFVCTTQIMKNVWQQIIIVFILFLNISLTNSKISMLLGLIALIYVLVINRKPLYYLFLKFKYTLYFCILSTIFMVWYFEPQFYIEIRDFLSAKNSYEKSLKYFQLGLAPREQILVVMFNDGISIFGEGAYTYFNLLKGSFEKTYRHFSQLIWFYHDLGIIGLLLLSFFFNRIGKLFNDNKSKFSSFLLIGLMIYSYFTIVTFDISFILIYFLYTCTDDKSSSIHTIS